MNTTETIAKLTAKGTETMLAIGKRELSFFDEGVIEHSGSWGECLVSEMGHKSSGVINQLRKLGLLASSPDGPEDESDWWSLTALGADVANALAGNDAPMPETTPEAAETSPLPAEQPMTKAQAYEWVKRARAGLRESDAAIYTGTTDELRTAINDVLGCASELLAALDADRLVCGAAR